MTDQTDQPRVLVFGAGAVGTLLGGILSGAGYGVALLGRGQAIDAIKQHGLTIELPDRRFQTTPAAVTSLIEPSGAAAQFDIILLTVRTYAVAEALEAIAGSLAHGGVLVSFQNGIGIEELIQQKLSAVHHVAGSLTLSADIGAPGSASSSSRSGGIGFAPVSSGAPVDRLASMFRSGSLPVVTYGDYRSMKWSKLLLNQMGNGIPAILDWTPGQLYRHPRTFQFEQAMLRETLQVLSADGAHLVSLPGFPVPLLSWVLRLPSWVARRLLLRRVEGGRGAKLPSLLLDLHAARAQLEAKWLYGVVAERGARLGIDARINRRVHRTLEAIAADPEIWDQYRNQPERIIDPS